MARWVGRNVGVLVAGNQLMVGVTVEVGNGMVGVNVGCEFNPEHDATNRLRAATIQITFFRRIEFM